MSETAHADGDAAIAITFDPHPAETLGFEPPPLLTTVKRRIALLAELGLDALVVLPFTPVIARTPAIDFVETLIHHLHLAQLWGGSDFVIGYEREGDVAFLRDLGTKRDFTVRVVDPLIWQGAPVSSSRVRSALTEGDIPQASGCLGRPYRLAGTVVPGDGRGHTIGIPTANISPPPGRLIPATGIYACRAVSENLGTHLAVVNIGTRPTFTDAADKPLVTIEAHLLDFEADLYGQTLALDFVARLRDEYAFPNAGALVAQIQDDIRQARAALGD
jgi:riboflavin kinase/FMN adenylyltransferase